MIITICNYILIVGMIITEKIILSNCFLYIDVFFKRGENKLVLLFHRRLSHDIVGCGYHDIIDMSNMDPPILLNGI